MLSWNCRGLGNPWAVQALISLVRTKKPHLVFLIETKMMKNKVEFIRIKLGYDRMFVVDCKGRSGGLLLLWNSESHMEIQNFSRHHINAVVLNQSNESV
jgi:exonuclease III